MNQDEQILSFYSESARSRVEKHIVGGWRLQAEGADPMKDLLCPSSNVCSFLFQAFIRLPFHCRFPVVITLREPMK